MNREIVIKNCNNIGEYINQVNEDFLLISITDPELDFAEIPENKHCDSILRLKFHDVVKKKEGKEHFKKKHAKLIKHFIKNNDTRLIICQCRSGVSRSPAIGAAIARMYNLDTKPFFTTGGYVPNLLVFKTLLKTFNVKDAEKEVEKHRQMWLQSMRNIAGI